SPASHRCDQFLSPFADHGCHLRNTAPTPPKIHTITITVATSVLTPLGSGRPIDFQPRRPDSTLRIPTRRALATIRSINPVLRNRAASFRSKILWTSDESRLTTAATTNTHRTGHGPIHAPIPA